MTNGRTLVIHVVPADLARGAQTRAREVRNALHDEHSVHCVLSIFDVPEPAGLVDCSLSAHTIRRSTFLSPQALIRLRRVIKAHQPDVVIAYGSEALRYCAIVTPKRVTLIYSKTGVMTEGMSWIRLKAHRRMAKKADHLAAVSTETAQEAAALLHVPQDQITVVSNGRDPEVFSPRTTPRAGPARLVWVGHLTVTKRPDLFIDVVRILRRRNRALEAVVVGDGPTLGALREQAADNDVTLLGRRSDVPEILRAGDVFVFTGEREGEGLPGVLIEASLSGLPIVTTDVPGARDVVIDGYNGFVVTSRRATEISDAIERLVEDTDLRARMGANGRRRSEELFTVASSAARWRELLVTMNKLSDA